MWPSVLQNAQITRNYLIFQTGMSWNINTITMVCYDDNCALCVVGEGGGHKEKEGGFGKYISHSASGLYWACKRCLKCT